MSIIEDICEERFEREREAFRSQIAAAKKERDDARDSWDGMRIDRDNECQAKEAAEARAATAREEADALRGALRDLFQWGVTHNPNDTAPWERARAALLPTPEAT